MDDFFGAPDPEDPQFLEDLLIGDSVDPYAQELFREFVFGMDSEDNRLSQSDIEDAYATLVDYMWDNYDIDFEEVYDWVDYREWIEENSP